MIVDVTAGRGLTEREIGYTADLFIDIVPEKVAALIARGRVAIVGDFTKLPLPNHSVDMIVFDPPFQVYGFGKKPSFVGHFGSFNNLKHASESFEKAFKEFRRVLQPNGIVLLKWGTNHKPLWWVLGFAGEAGFNGMIHIERLSLACQPEKPYSHKARVYWVELWVTPK